MSAFGLWVDLPYQLPRPLSWNQKELVRKRGHLCNQLKGVQSFEFQKLVVPDDIEIIFMCMYDKQFEGVITKHFKGGNHRYFQSYLS